MTTDKILQSVRQLEPKYFDIHVDRYRFILKQVSLLNLPKSAKILDVGCFPPHLSAALTKLGHLVYGISFFNEKKTLPRVSKINIENQKLPYQDNSFDLILFSEVLEHLIEYPDNFFSEVYRLLKKEAYFFITTPNAARLQNIALLLLNKNIYPPLPQFQSTHIQDGTIYHRHNREYTLPELNTIFSKYPAMKATASGYFISFSPFRPKNRQDTFLLKIIKTLNYFLMLLFPNKKDTLFMIYQKL